MATEHQHNFYGVIPAGGSGTRLWPLSRTGWPKFLLPLPGPRTMIQETMARLDPLVHPGNILIVTGSRHALEIGRQLPQLSDKQFIIEPSARGTGPAIGLAVALIAHQDPDAIVGSFAADHHVLYPDRFIADVEAAIAVAKQGYLVTIGIEPEEPETGYGYIRVGDELGQFHERSAYLVQSFQEKPDLATAQRFLAEGGYLWNASMFVWQAKTLLNEMQRLLPDLHQALQAIVQDWDTPQREQTFASVWPTISDVTIDQGILEHSQQVAVIPSQMGWSDLGDWHSVGRLKDRDSEPLTVIDADVLTVDCGANLVYGNGRLVGLVGVEGLVVIDTDDALLICDRSRSQEVKDIVAQLRARRMEEYL